MEPSQDPILSTTSHPHEDQIENYALGRLSSEEEIEKIETHLLVCHSCQDQLAAADDYVGAMKGALEEMSVRAEAKPVKWWANWRPVPAFSLAVAALSVVMIVSYQRTPQGEPAEVVLQSLRGAPETAEGPAKSPLRLAIQSAQLKIDGSHRGEVVDASGKQVWSGSPDGGVLRIEKGLDAGLYWVRLSDAEGNLLQEYGLNLK